MIRSVSKMTIRECGLPLFDKKAWGSYSANTAVVQLAAAENCGNTVFRDIEFDRDRVCRKLKPDFRPNSESDLEYSRRPDS